MFSIAALYPFLLFLTYRKPLFGVGVGGSNMPNSKLYVPDSSPELWPIHLQ